MTVGGMGFIPERLLMMMMMINNNTVLIILILIVRYAINFLCFCFILVPVYDRRRYGIYS